MAQGPLGPPKMHLVGNIQFWQFATGPDLSKRGPFFKAVLHHPNVEKCDQGPLGPLKLHLVGNIQF